MKKQKTDVCPGCGRHCTADSVRCKRGRAYFAERGAAERKRKWEKYVTARGAVWELLRVSGQIKKALRGGAVTEGQILEALGDEGQSELLRVVERLRSRPEISDADV